MNTLDDMIRLQKKIVPELADMVSERYSVLKQICQHQPIGRRALAGILTLSESSIRNDIRILKDSGLIELSGVGMTISDEGRALLDGMVQYAGMLNDIPRLAAYLKQELGVNHIEIVPGNCETDKFVFNELGRMAACIVEEILGDNMTVAVSGGSTMTAVAAAMDKPTSGVMVVPTRGGLGGEVERQASNVAVIMARNINGRYRLLHIPEALTAAAYEEIKAADSSVGEIEQLIKSADILVHGVGRADVMAHRRNHSEKVLENICRLASGETLGHYFDIQGNCIYTYCNHGFRLNDLVGVGRKVVVAGGPEKAEAIIGVTRAGSKDVLVMDEAAARKIQSIIKSEQAQKTF